ncbi:MAG: methylated-DNA--[Bacteroidales bacterium]|nr:methylated-DNA--[protein]-cysteine S-methyltransferase [Bacteroidales bacterium]
MQKNKNIICIQKYESPCGNLILGSYEGKLCLCDWENDKHRNKIDKHLCKVFNAEYKEEKSPVILQAMKELDEYFAQKRKEFNIPLLFIGTDFQKRVWQHLLSIPYGKTISYKLMATQMQIPNSVRAVANANGANAISIFAPCHRVIGHDNTLTGYGGGIETKRYLLELEDNTRLFK